MTYTVKNGTWCKDNNKEYYSTTKTGLKAALAAGEITSGTKVIIHEPQYHAGQLIQSLNPECPEGCFVPHGQAFDTNIYTELAKLFPDGNLPDMRECVMVCAGRSERTEITNHDEYTAGQFKDDQFAEHNHNVSSTVTDPGHSHPVTDPGHDHGRGTFEITGSFGGIDSSSHVARPTGAFTIGDGEGSGHISTDDLSIHFTASRAWTGRSEKVTTGVSISSGTTGISISSGTTGITVDTTEEKAGAADNVTHGKQFGVYYYIAF